MTINYWHLKNEDPTIHEFAKNSTESILESFEKLVDKYTENSFQRRSEPGDKKIRHPVFFKSDQRIDFEINLYEEIIKNANSKLTELEKERDSRL